MQIRLGTLNAWALPEPLARDVSARIRAIGDRLTSLDLDVLAFQEVWTRESRRNLRLAGRRAGLPHCWDGEEASGALGAGSGGLMVLSRFPIEQVHFESYALRGEVEQTVATGEYVSGKGFASLRLRTPVGPLALIDTHLHARYTRRSPHRHVPHRVGQTIQLATYHAGTDEPLIAVGDFNFLEGEPDYRVLTGILGINDAAAVLDRRQATTSGSNPYRDPTARGRRKDYIFARDGLRQGIVLRDMRRVFDEPLEFHGGPAAYSNHAGLVVEFEMGGLPGSPQVPADPEIVALASELLAQGKKLAKRRRKGGRQLSGVGVSVAAAAGLGMVPRRVSRRRMLRTSLGAACLLALTPGVGVSYLTEVLVQDDIRTFKRAEEQLALLARERSALA
jgi:endonuclease/exonuclease/phosphatase family metal-dependent hydrolase